MPGRSKKKNILCIGSHPDDIEFGCGGLVCRFAEQGHSVYALVMTTGSGGGEPETRKKEQERSASILGVCDIFWGGFTDTRLPLYDNVIPEIEKVVKKVAPGFVFVHHGKDTHQDHRHISACTVAATRNVRNVLFYEGPTSFDFDPDVFVDIGPCMRKKFRALSCHRSQLMRTNIEHQSIQAIAKSTAIFRGTQCRIQHAEAFSSLRMFIDP